MRRPHQHVVFLLNTYSLQSEGGLHTWQGGARCLPWALLHIPTDSPMRKTTTRWRASRLHTKPLTRSLSWITAISFDFRRASFHGVHKWGGRAEAYSWDDRWVARSVGATQIISARL